MVMQLIFRSPEVRLMETLGNIHDPAGWHAVHFHLDDLLEQYKSEYQVKIAINLIHDLLKNYDGTIFLFGDNSIMVLCYGLEKTVRSKLVFQLRYLYMDDPKAYSEDGRENPQFASNYDLGRDWDEFFHRCSRRMARSVRRASGEHVSDSTMPAMSLSASRLVTIERDLQHADISSVIRRQPVCALKADMTIHRVFGTGRYRARAFAAVVAIPVGEEAGGGAGRFGRRLRHREGAVRGRGHLRDGDAVLE
jgi:hypothetical protein